MILCTKGFSARHINVPSRKHMKTCSPCSMDLLRNRLSNAAINVSSDGLLRLPASPYLVYPKITKNLSNQAEENLIVLTVSQILSKCKALKMYNYTQKNKYSSAYKTPFNPAFHSPSSVQRLSPPCCQWESTPKRKRDDVTGTKLHLTCYVQLQTSSEDN